jgi:hypothetical protein
MSATRTETPVLSPTPTATISPTWSVSPTFSASATPGAPKDLLAPVPAGKNQALRLCFSGPAGSSRWLVYNVAGELVARLAYPAGQAPAWDHAGLAAGVYFARVEIEDPAGSSRAFWQKFVLLP